MAPGHRDRVTVDLRGLGPAVKAEAAARHLTLAAFARAAIVESLKRSAADAEHVDHDVDEAKRVKLTLRLPPRQAHRLVAHARSAGLSYGTFLASLIDGAPYPGGLADAVRSLTGSSDQMATLSRDLHYVIRMLRHGTRADIEPYRHRVISLFDEVREHLRLTASLAAEVRSAVRLKPTDSGQQ
jgi:hypothetical protein